MANLDVPSFFEEKQLRQQGYRFIAGVDEVGRGALAGPVLAAAVIMPASVKTPWRKDVRDSKLLSPAQRESLFDQIYGTAVAVGIGSSDVWTIESLGIVRATEIAMEQAVKQLSPKADAVLIDYMRVPGIKVTQKGVVDGDTLCFSIACASIMAKVTRDRLMEEMDRIHPGYKFAQHKGYGTEEHIKRLRRLGPSPIHRRTFQPVAEIVNPRIKL
jgi:ribonuclease HII